MKYCPKCGEGTPGNPRFCKKCGAVFPEKTINLNTKFCRYCGATMDLNATQCSSCGKYLDYDDDHQLAIVLGYIFSFLNPLVGVIAGFYLVTQENKNVHKHGFCMFLISIIVTFVLYIFWCIY